MLAHEANDLAKLDKDEIYYGMVPLSIALRWNRGYDLFLQNLLDKWCQSEKEGLDSVTNALSRNRKALIPLIARWKLPGSEWLLPDEEGFSAKVGESLLNNGVPDYNGREALLRVQAELAQEEGVTEEIFRVAEDQVQNPPQTEFMKRLDKALQFAPKEIQNLRERFDDN